MRLPRIVATALLLIAVSSPATAQQHLVERSFETQLFEPAIGVHNYLTVEGPWVADHLGFGVGLIFNYQHDPLVLYMQNRSGASSGSFDLDEAMATHVVENQVTADVTGALGLRWGWLRAQVGLDLPVNLLLTGKNVSEEGVPTDDLSATGIGDLKLQLKAMLFQDLAGFSLALSPIVTFPTGKDDGFGGDPNLSVRPRLVFGFRHGAFTAAANVGYLIRENSVMFSSEIGDQLLYGAGASYQFHDRVTVLAELFGRAGFSTRSGCAWDATQDKAVCEGSSNEDADAYPLEVDFGPRIKVYHGLTATAGAGFGILRAIGTPVYRVLAGVQWAPDFRDSDHDGVYDYADGCPNEPEDKDHFQDSDGCPDRDNDGDLITDAQDQCPNEGEDRDSFKDEDGCPDPDNDSDGIADIKDGCPFAPETKNGYKDNDGCPDVPDQDDDGVEDAKDKCLKDPEDKDGFEDLDGCPDPDNDNDGVPDNLDECPNAAEDMDNFKDDDGCPDPDNDGDGVLDAKDKCPDKPETINGFKDEDGCPDTGESHVIVEKNKIVITKKVFFATDKAVIKPISFGILNEVALTLRANPQIKKLRIEGHTDNQGNAAHNKVLSQKRAEAVQAYLVKQGIDAGRLSAVGYGPEKPIEDNKTEKGRAANRRVEFVILEDAAPAQQPAKRPEAKQPEEQPEPSDGLP